MLAAKTAPFDIVLPTVPHLVERITHATAGWQIRPRIVVDQEDKWAAFRIRPRCACRIGDGHARTCGRRRADHRGVQDFAAGRDRRPLDDRTPTIVLANLVLGENVMPEILQRDATPQKLAAD